MYARVHSSAVLGIDAYTMEVEVDLTNALPRFDIVGLPDTSIKESRDRINAAFKNSGYLFPQKKITVNLAPAEIQKEGPSLDLPIAMGVLAAGGQVNVENAGKYFVLGELSLDGTLRPVKGILPVALRANAENVEGLIVPKANASEAAVVEGLHVYGFEHVVDVIRFLNGDNHMEPFRINLEDTFRQASRYEEDFRDVKGQDLVKRALEVAAAGSHNILLIGPPGSGKTMLARRLPTILPKMTLEESLETTKIHSISGLLREEQALVATRPFRAPHHTVSDAGLIGGGRFPQPGQVSLSHNGVLFLDELPEFNRGTLEVLRQPLEDGYVTISRVNGTLTYPSRFMLAAACNPCPCGYLGDPVKHCQCNPQQIQRYIGKISGPLLDRIDIHIEVPSVSFEELNALPTGDTSEQIRERVQRTRDRQEQRYKGRSIHCNAHMAPKDLKDYCPLDDECREMLRNAIDRLGLSARAYDRIIKVARTIADLEGTERIEAPYIAEAIQYRTLDRKFGFV